MVLEGALSVVSQFVVTSEAGVIELPRARLVGRRQGRCVVGPRRRCLVAVIRLRLFLHAAHPRRTVIVVGDQRPWFVVDVDGLERGLSSPACHADDDDDNNDDDGNDRDPDEECHDDHGVGEEAVDFRLQVGRLWGLDGDDSTRKTSRSHVTRRPHVPLVSLRAVQPHWTSLARSSHRAVQPSRSRHSVLASLARLAVLPPFLRRSMWTDGADTAIHSLRSPLSCRSRPPCDGRCRGCWR